MGKHEEAILRQVEREGGVPPPGIANAPELQEGLEMYLRAFSDLDSCRSVGMGPGRIPWREVQAYALAIEADEEQREALHHHVAALDEAYLAWNASQGKS